MVCVGRWDECDMDAIGFSRVFLAAAAAAAAGGSGTDERSTLKS